VIDVHAHLADVDRRRAHALGRDPHRAVPRAARQLSDALNPFRGGSYVGFAGLSVLGVVLATLSALAFLRWMMPVRTAECSRRRSRSASASRGSVVC
jgi:hypothetical protein